MAGRDHAGVAEACAGRDLWVAFDDHDLVAVPLQLIGGRDADHAAAEHHYAHGRHSNTAGGNWQSPVALAPTPRREAGRERGDHPSLAQNASNAASAANDFCAPRRVTERAA